MLGVGYSHVASGKHSRWEWDTLTLGVGNSHVGSGKLSRWEWETVTLRVGYSHVGSGILSRWEWETLTLGVGNSHVESGILSGRVVYFQPYIRSVEMLFQFTIVLGKNGVLQKIILAQG